MNTLFAVYFRFLYTKFIWKNLYNKLTSPVLDLSSWNGEGIIFSKYSFSSPPLSSPSKLPTINLEKFPQSVL